MLCIFSRESVDDTCQILQADVKSMQLGANLVWEWLRRAAPIRHRFVGLATTTGG